MKVRIEKKAAFTVVGIKKTFRNDSTENMLPRFWAETPKEVYDRLRSLANAEPKWFVGVCADFDGSHEFDYYIAVATTNDVPNGFVKYDVPAATWAILEKDGEFMDLHTRFWKEWLPSSGYRRASESIPDVEVYPDADMPVDEICALMTYEEARDIIVDVGTCKGWTLAQVAERRAASLKWYLNGYQGDNNVREFDS